MPPEVVSDALTRLRRIEGQARGVQQMLSEDRACGEVIIQLSAMRAAINKLAVTIITENLQECLQGDPGAPDTQQDIEEAKRALLRFS